ncbi:hypothetical protein BKA64DRAFT_342542 [Cadophora sp. MPI-SDFR-AT-0126]|nr:hypothetical protein BKA64DRAFT_342542 [Leotiomycetes sp. MPI-SDFR-AT-0126]
MPVGLSAFHSATLSLVVNVSGFKTSPTQSRAPTCQFYMGRVLCRYGVVRTVYGGPAELITHLILLRFGGFLWSACTSLIHPKFSPGLLKTAQPSVPQFSPFEIFVISQFFIVYLA